MKSIFLLSFLLLTGCSSSEDSSGSPVAAPANPTDPAGPITTAAPPPEGAKRTLTHARAMATTPENLVLDPTFGSFDATYAQGVLLSDATGHVESTATSPAGPSQPVFVLTPTGNDGSVFFPVQGGTGPLDVTVYAAGDATVTLFDASGSNAFEVELSASGAQTHGSRTYKMYHATITDLLIGRLYLMVGSNQGEVAIAPPEVSSPAAKSTFSLHAPARRIVLGSGGKRALAVAAAQPVFHGAQLPNRPRPVVDLSAGGLRR